MMKFNPHYSLLQTSQSQPIPNQPQVENNAGGFVYEISPWQQLKRFLILGSEGGTFYVNEQTLTVENATAITRCLQEDGLRVMEMIVDISNKGLAQKNDAAIFALALCMSGQASIATRQLAGKEFNKVVRTGTHLFQFLEAVKGLRGWGRLLKNTLTHWYLDKEVDPLAYQLTKYQNRMGWTHRDVLRKLHIQPPNEQYHLLFQHVVGKSEESNYDLLPKVVRGHLQLTAETAPAKAAKLILDCGLTHEMVPNELKSHKEVWEALLQHMPLGAVLRNLNKMTVVELLTNRSEATQIIVQRLQDQNYIRKSRLHPITILTALKQYSSGRGMRGSLTWTAVPKIVDALDSAFYSAFANAKPVGGAGVCLALDVSGSMSGARGENILSPREITAAMALVTANVEPNHEIMAFSRGFVPLSISPNMRLDQVLKTIDGLPFDATDCAQPMLWAMNKKEQFDLFVIYTDNETWCGKIHPSQALQQYRQKFNQKARLVVCATDATKFSIADPKDPGMLDIAGFSSDVPEVISSFGRGEI
jgi:60 kDa SS-A/Ro ribonucleoprotein